MATASTPQRIGLIGLGGYLPERVMTNDEWTQYVDTSDTWIRERSGIERRRIAAEDESTTELAVAAARSALADADLDATDLDEIIIATDTPEYPVPDTAAFVQHQLGAREIPAFDLAGSGCAGYLQALDVARGRVLLGAERVLVVGVEALSKRISWRQRETDVLFGDAAGAAIVGANARVEILAAVAGTDGSKADILCFPNGGTKNPFTEAMAKAGLHHKIVMDGRAVFREAVKRMSAAAQDVLAKAGRCLDEVDLVVPHQANLRIIHAVAKKLGVGLERFVINVQHYGNTGSASIPVALWEADQAGRIKPGALVLCPSFGAGFHWSALLLRFGDR